jgi:molecular chaperone GrpE (heat shock protein)
MTDLESRLDSLADQLTKLGDLFRRRLLDDRDKRTLIDQLTEKVDRLERSSAAEAARPLVTRLALVIDRLDATLSTAADSANGAACSGPQAEDPVMGLVRSIADEILDVLDAMGVTVVDEAGVFDPKCHEVVEVSGEGSSLEVLAVRRRGFVKDGVVLRPALVAVRRFTPAVTSVD